MQTSAFDRPSAMALMASTAPWPCSRGGLKPNVALEPIEQLGVGDLGDADGAVALHVGVTAQRADAGALAADLAAHQHQVGELLHVRVPCWCCVRPMP